MSRSLARRGLPWAACLILMICSAGCSPRRANVRGKVTYQNAPVTGLYVNILWQENGFAAWLPIEDDGSFAVTEMVPGTYAVHLSPRPPEQLPPGVKPKKHVVTKVPPKYMDVTKSDLQATLKSGDNEFLIELND